MKSKQVLSHIRSFSHKLAKNNIIRGVQKGVQKSVQKGGAQKRLKHPASLLIVLVIIAIIGLALFIRAQPIEQPFATLQAQNAVLVQVQQDIQADITSQYPELPQQSLQQASIRELQQSIIDDTYTFKTGLFEGQNITLSEYTTEITELIRDNYRDENNINYLPDIDTYYWLPYTENIVNTGSIGFEEREGRAYDSKQLAPNGRAIPQSDKFHPYFLAVWWQGLELVGDTSLREAASFYPLFVVTLTLLLVFLIAKRLGGTNKGANIGAVIATLLVAVNPFYTGRTLWGRADTDAWVIFFTVLAIWLILEALTQKTAYKRWLAGIGAGAGIGVFSFTWSAWEYAFLIVFLALCSCLAYTLIVRYKDWKNALKEQISKKSVLSMLLLFTFSSFIFVSIFNRNVVAFFQVISFIEEATLIKDTLFTSLWPNVLTTVAELGTSNTAGVINVSGGLLIFFGLVGIALLITQRVTKTEEHTTQVEQRKKEQRYWFLGIFSWWAIVLLFFVPPQAISIIFFTLSEVQVLLLFFFLPLALWLLRLLYLRENINSFGIALLLLWFGVTFYASTTGNRFLLLFSVPLAVAVGVGSGLLFHYITKWIQSELHINAKVTAIAGVFIVLLLLAVPVNTQIDDSFRQAQQEQPLLNDAWWDALKSIENNSAENAIITSWWDFGHQFKQVANRSVTFDGATQATPQGYWVGRFFLESNEQKARGILRMLNCGGNNAFDALDEEMQNTVASVNLLESTLGMSRSETKNTLREEGVSDATIEIVLLYTHCEPPESFVIASQDMIGKSGVWAHFGSWNFSRAEALVTVKQAETNAIGALQEKGFDEEQATQLYNEIIALSREQEEQWIAPYPSYLSPAIPCVVNGESISCQNGFTATTEGTITALGSFTQPEQFTYFDPTIHEYQTTTQEGTDALLIGRRSDNTYFGLQTDAALVDSMFTRMFFEAGARLEHFELLTLETNVLGTEIYVWQVKWY